MRKNLRKVLWLIAMLVLTSSAFAQRIAVLNFNAGTGVTQDEVDGISSIFNTYFEPKGAEIIERTRVDRLLQEQEFQKSNFTTNDMVAIGKILNVSLVVVGDVNIVMGQYNVDIRVVNVQTGTVVAKDGISFNKNTSYRGTMQQLGIQLSKTLSLCMLSCGKEIAYNDTIQDTFYGVKFGASREEVINAFEKQGLYLYKSVSTNDFLQFYPHGKYFSFGGMSWQFVNVGLSNGKFCAIAFSVSPENKESALEDYEEVLEQISSKYNVAERPIEDENLYKKSGGRTKDGRYITVYCHKDESFGGEMRYYVTLAYGNEKFQGVSNEL